MELETVKEYYKNVDLKPLFNIDKDFFKFRQLRFLLHNNSWVKIRDSIKNEKDLRKQYLKWLPIKAYYTVSRFLAQDKSDIGKKQTKTYYDSVFLYQDRLVLDIDKDIEKNVEIISKSIPKKTIEYVCLSGQKGFHISLKLSRLSTKFSVLHHLPEFREEKYRKRNEYIIEVLKAMGLTIDTTNSNVINTRQIVKIPLSLSMGSVCKLVDKDKLDMILELVRYQMKKRFDELKGVDKSSEYSTPNTPININNESLHSSLIITNQVDGTKCYIFFLVTDYYNKYNVSEFIRKFNLSDVYFFVNRDKTKKLYICLKKMNKMGDFRRIYNYFGLRTSKKYRYSFINLSDWEYVGRFYGNKFPESQISQYHKDILKWKFGIDG